LDEVLEFELSSWNAPRQIEKLLAQQLPEGISVVSAEAFDRKDRSIIEFVEYQADCPGQGEALPGGIRHFLGLSECLVERASDKGSKTVDVRRYVLAADCEKDRAFLRIRVTDQGTAKPEEVLRALGVRVDGSVRIRKTFTEVAIRP
jgi:hypothetical protein